VARKPDKPARQHQQHFRRTRQPQQNLNPKQRIVADRINLQFAKLQRPSRAQREQRHGLPVQKYKQETGRKPLLQKRQRETRNTDREKHAERGKQALPQQRHEGHQHAAEARARKAIAQDAELSPNDRLPHGLQPIERFRVTLRPDSIHKNVFERAATARRLLAQVLHRSFYDDLAAMDNRHAITKPLHDFEHM
jgi:hypothetical protein